MRKKRAYRAADVKNVRLERVLASSPSGTVSVGLDVGKFEVLAVVRWADGTFERPWKVKNPSEIRQLVRLLREVSVKHALMVTMESTGTYGDALRQALTDAELEIRRVVGLRGDLRRSAFQARREGCGHHGGTCGVGKIVALALSWQGRPRGRDGLLDGLVGCPAKH